MGIDEIHALFPEFSKDQLDKLEALPDLYSEWNQKINVVSRKDIDQIYTRHILHSLSILKYFQFTDGQLVMDLGTGGGFPGIPLAIAWPSIKFHLVDSIGKKIKVVNEVAASLDLQNVEGFHERVENMHSSYDHIVTRAVAPMPKLLHWVATKIKPGGSLVALKGGDLTEEVKGLDAETHELREYFMDEFFQTKKVVVFSPQ